MLWDAWETTGWQHTFSMVLLKDQLLMTFIVCFSVFLVAEIPLISLKFKNFAWKKNELRYALLLGSLLLILLLQFWSIPIIVFLYLVLSFLEAATQKKN